LVDMLAKPILRDYKAPATRDAMLTPQEQLQAAAKLFLKQRQPAAAHKLLEAAATATPPDPILATVYATALMRDKQPRRAATYILPLLQSQQPLERDPVAHNLYAQARIQAGEYGAAAAHLTPLLPDLLREDTFSHTIYANALDKMGQPVAAAAHLHPHVQPKQFLAVEPAAHKIYAQAKLHAEDYTAVVQHLHPLIQDGQLLANDPSTLNTYSKALQKLPEHAAIVVNSATIAADWALAKAEYRAVAAVTPHYPRMAGNAANGQPKAAGKKRKKKTNRPAARFIQNHI
jgi:hypothetical protein